MRGGRLGREARALRDLPERLLAQRDGVRAAFAAHPVLALLAAVGKWGFDYLALICVLAALGARPEPALVLLAYAAAQLLGMIPSRRAGSASSRPGSTGLLALAGVPAGDGGGRDARLPARRRSGCRCPSGGVAYLLARRRYGAGGANAASTRPSTSDATSSPP